MIPIFLLNAISNNTKNQEIPDINFKYESKEFHSEFILNFLNFLNLLQVNHQVTLITYPLQFFFTFNNQSTTLSKLVPFNALIEMTSQGLSII